ncbi:hypothetical protein Tco_1418561 [Tanacetum coccineum]
MSSSTVTYTLISSDYEEPSDVGHAPPSLDYVSVPEHPPSLDYVPGREEPEQAPLSLVYLHEPEYPEYLVPSDVEAPREDQPLPDDASPTALSLGYVADSDPEEDSEEDPEEDPADYPADGGDDDDDDESSDDDDDDDDDVEEDEEEEEEEHLALADSTALLAINLVPLQRHSRSMSLRLHHYHHLHTVLLLGYSSPPLLVPSPPLPLPPPITSPTYAEVPLGYRAAGIWWRAISPPTHHPSKIPSPPLLLPFTTYRDDIPKANMLLQKRARFITPTGRFEIRESSLVAAARQAGHALAHIVDYGFIDTMNASIRASEIRAMTSVGVVNDRVTDLATTQRQDAQELYMHYEDAQDD